MSARQMRASFYISPIKVHEVFLKGHSQLVHIRFRYHFIANLHTFSSPEPTILLACGRNRELWEQPCWNNKGKNRILPITAQSASTAHAWNGCSQSSRFPTAGQEERRLWERDWSAYNGDAINTVLTKYDKNNIIGWAKDTQKQVFR